MKVLTAAMALMVLGACNDQALYTEEEVIKEFGAWYITPRQAGIIKRNYDNCTLPDRRLCMLREHLAYELIDDKVKRFFSGRDWRFNWQQGRYSQGDVDRYKLTRPRVDPEAEKIAGFATLIMEVSNLRTSELYYFDYAIICPPPNGTCDLSPPVTAEN